MTNTGMNNKTGLFSPVELRSLRLKNRLVVPPMCQYSAKNGLVNDWHFAHLAKFAMGGFGAIITEACAVLERGRITHGDLGIWSDAHAEALKPIVSFLKGQNCAPGIQIAHAGRKASIQRPWHGNGPLDETDAARGETPWPISGASALPAGEGWLMPAEMTKAEIADVVEAFVQAAKRADDAGFEIVEIHGAHGYLIQSFLSPLSNKRGDAYGGDLAGRMRLALEVTEAVRAAWPGDKPLFFRVSAVDGFEGGWELDESIELARALKGLGVDVIDCSSGGNSAAGATASTGHRGPGFQVPYAEAIRHKADIMTMAVGLITQGPQAQDVLDEGAADLIAIGREALYNPFWPLHQADAMGKDDAFQMWPEQYGWWLSRRSAGRPQLEKAER